MPINLIIRNPLDRDAREFIQRAGVTDAAARLQLNEFVRGVKQIGLWDSMVCWPLRSTQNAGTGTTAYSLGGLGTFNSTLVNGPTWGADGLTFDATNKNVQIPNEASLRNTRSAIVVFNSNSNLLNQELLEISDQQGTGSFVSFRFDGQNFGGTFQGLKYGVTRNANFIQNINSTRPINLGQWRTAFFTADDATDNVFENGTLAAGGAKTGLNPINSTGTVTVRRIFAQSNNQTGAFAMVSTAKWSNSHVTALHNLYRDTLGTGLGLP